MVEQVTVVGQVKGIINFPIDIFNRVLAIFSPNEILILFIISIVIGFFLKSRYKAGTIEFIILSLTVFFAFRFILGI